jgi:hypothetical protein
LKRIKINTTFEQDEEERRQFFAKLSYSERLKYFLEARKLTDFHQLPLARLDLRINHSYSIPNKLVMNY